MYSTLVARTGVVLLSVLALPGVAATSAASVRSAPSRHFVAQRASGRRLQPPAGRPTYRLPMLTG